jgi:short-subunit dehydrogenase
MEAQTDVRALVTGASSGIGEQFARSLRDRGERLVVVARRAERLARLREELGSEAVLAVPLDLTGPGACRRLGEELRARGVAVGLLVNNAGVGRTGPFCREKPDETGGILDLNVRAAVELTRIFVPDMVARGQGALINVVSMSAFQPVPFLATYAASKAFLLSFTEALASELSGTGVRVQALCPGLVPTEFQARAGTDKVRFDRTRKQSPRFVVEASLGALGSGRVLVIPGWRDRILVTLQRLLPRAVVRRAAAELFRPGR